MSNSIWALDLLKFAFANGYTVKVDDGENFEKYDSAIAAWNMVKEVGEARVYFYKDGKREWAYLMVPGPMSCDNNETVVDHSCGGFIEKWWDEKFAKEME